MPAEIISAAIEVVRPLADEKSIQLETSFEASAGPISVDPMRFHQILWNLLMNSIKFTPKNGKIQVRLETITGPQGDHVQIKVIDTGKGFSPQFQLRIFDKFSQADPSNTQIQGGLGLGLAIVKNLVEQHKGTVSAESPGEGKGSIFSVTLPLTVSSPTQKKLKLLRLNADQVSLKGLRVLIVEDDASAREGLAETIKAFGAAIWSAASAREALEALSRFKPHVLICDIAMPDEDGYTLIQKIRALRSDQGGTTPAIALTAYAGSEDAKRALAAGFQIHAAKPIDASHLAGLIAKVGIPERPSKVA